MTSETSQSGLESIRLFVIEHGVIDHTIEFLRRVGTQGYEGFVLWSGYQETADEFRFSSAFIPEQKAMITPNGLMVIVEGEALFKINKAVHERNEILGAQVHTHPTSAYHSSTDDHYPLVTLLGALSLVLPDFAQNAPADREAWAWYRLVGTGLWKPAQDSTEVVFE